MENLERDCAPRESARFDIQLHIVAMEFENGMSRGRPTPA
jgi:hypothetical protein